MTLADRGLQDAAQVRVSLGMIGPGQEIAWTVPQTVTVLAGETAPVIFPWAPASPGEWKLLAQARLLDHEGAPIKSVAVEQVVEVLPAEQTTFSQELSAFGLVQPWQVAGLVVALLLAAALTAWAFSRLRSETSA